MLKKILMFAIVFGIVVTVWNFYKAKRESRTFISQFSNVQGLSKGAPIFSNGVEVGKIIKIFPIGNSNNVAVKGLITKDEFPSPRGSVNTRIITNFQDGVGCLDRFTYHLEYMYTTLQGRSCKQFDYGTEYVPYLH